MDRAELQRVLGLLDAVPEPDPALEQYRTPPDVAADVLWTARMQGDLQGRVVDLGCGNGTFAIGAAMLGATAQGYDMDEAAVAAARENAATAAEAVGRALEASFTVSDVEDVDDTADCVVMNPPFGVQAASERDVNLRFVAAALDIAPVVFAVLHRSAGKQAETRQRVADAVGDRCRSVAVVASYDLAVPARFGFHTDERATVPVDLYKFERSTG